MCLKLLFLVLESRQEAKWIGDNDQDKILRPSYQEKSYGRAIDVCA